MTTREQIPNKQGSNKDYKVGYKKPPLETRWQPGQSGNPKGRPEDPGITPMQREMLDEPCPFDTKGRTWRKWLAERGLILASEKEAALRDLKDRIEGKVPDKHQLEGLEAKVVFIQFVPADRLEENNTKGLTDGA